MGEFVYKVARFDGVDQSLDEGQLPPGSSADAQNMDTADGNLAVAKGYAKHISAAVPGGIKSLMRFYRRDGPDYSSSLLAAGPQGIYFWNGQAWSFLKNLQSDRVNFLNYQRGDTDILIMCNGVDEVMVWDGLNISSAGCPHAFRHMALHYERVWGAGVPGQPDGVYWSRAFEADNWEPDPNIPDAGGGFVLVPTWNGGSVIGLKTIFNDIVVFKQEDLFRIYGTYPGEYQVIRVHGVIGPVAERTIVSAGDRCYFLSREGLSIYDGIRAVPLGDRKLKSMLSRINQSYLSEACAIIHGQVLYLAVPEGSSSVNNAVIEIDLKRNTYMIRRGFRVDCFLEWDDKLLFANNTGYVYQYGVGNTYDGQPIEAYWKTPLTSFGLLGPQKFTVQFRAVAEGSGPLVLEHGFDKRFKTKKLPVGTVRKLKAALRNRGQRLSVCLRNENGGYFKLLGGMELKVEVDDE